MPSTNVIVTANFALIPPIQYSLTMAATGSGSTSPAVGQHIYSPGTVVAVVATPALGYQFGNWTATAGSFADAGAPTTTFTMPAQNVTVTANFAPIPPIFRHLTVYSSAGGLVTTPGEGIFVYDPGTVVTLVATPDSGYYFVNHYHHERNLLHHCKLRGDLAHPVHPDYLEPGGRISNQPWRGHVFL
jgi:uncharacterized repeat protein (TIGR02543 family)